MSEQLLKLSPHRDLQCFFQLPSAIAAMSQASETGFTVSGCWRQQFDWAVVEWNRDNVYEHPLFRYLPDGDLSGLTLSYTETRTGCIPFESSLFPTVDWPYLRVWATAADGLEHIFYVPLSAPVAAPVDPNSYRPAYGTMTIEGSPTAGDQVGLAMPVAPAASAYPEQHYYYQVRVGDELNDIASGLAANINQLSTDFTASATGTSVTVTWVGSGLNTGKTGSDGNRISIYGFTNSGATESWAAPFVTLAGGAFPGAYQVTLNFGNLQGYRDEPLNQSAWGAVPTQAVRKLRWTWAADLQPGSFDRTEFQVLISNWQVTGTGGQWYVAGPGSRRLDDTAAVLLPSGTAGGTAWATGFGNYYGGSISYTTVLGATATFGYLESATHNLFLGVQMLTGGATISVSIDGGAGQAFNLALPGEQVLARLPLGSVAAGSHSVTVQQSGAGTLYLDFLEIAYPSADLPDLPSFSQLALATDWDTYHSQALAAERTAWMIQKLGFCGRVNHYVGALWFYELTNPGQVYASVQVTFSGTVTNNPGYVEMVIGPSSVPVSQRTAITHYVLPDDTLETVAIAFANIINSGYTSIWAAASGAVLTITLRQMTPLPTAAVPPTAISVTAGTGSVIATPSANEFAGGVAGTPYDDPPTDAALSPITEYWRTDLSAAPVLNRAARDWTQAFFTALAGYGIDGVASFSTELGNGDPNVSAGLAQRMVHGAPIVVNTPAVQTNFSLASTAFWTQVYQTTAALQVAAGMVPYLQSGEVQWWYFPSSQLTNVTDSMPFYDAYTVGQFVQQYGVPPATILVNNPAPAELVSLSNETTLFSGLLAHHTAAIRAALRAQWPNCRYEVLYPVDTNDYSLNQIVNFPSADWTPQNLTCLKTESFTYTNARNIDESYSSMETGAQKGFPASSASHLIGISDAQSTWMTEADLAQSLGLESVVLFALDQFCLIGYDPPPFLKQVRSQRSA